MNRSRLLTIIVFASAIAAGCGGKQSVASRSAAAYRDAMAKGIPVGAGSHGGHTNEHAAAPEPGSTMAGMNPGSMAGMDHSKMDHASMAGMDHSKMDHGSMAGMDHSKMDHGSMAGMGNMAGMHHATPAAVDLSAPATSGGIGHLNPSSTLQQDDFDKPATGPQSKGGGHR